MGAVTVNKLKLETEDDLQVVNALLTSVTDGDTWSINQFFTNIESFAANANSAVAVGFTASSGVITFKVAGGGNPNIWVRVAGN